MFNERIFSIGISQYHLDDSYVDNKSLCEYIKKSSPDVGMDGTLSVSRKQMDINNPLINMLNEVVFNHSRHIIQGITGNDKIDPELQRVWGNHNLNVDICTPHVHRQSFLSAIYYPKSTDGKIEFHNPWGDNIMSIIPESSIKEYSDFNSSYYTLYPKTGMLIIFPSNLLHYALPSANERISVVYDIGINI